MPTTFLPIFLPPLFAFHPSSTLNYCSSCFAGFYNTSFGIYHLSVFFPSLSILPCHPLISFLFLFLLLYPHNLWFSLLMIFKKRSAYNKLLLQRKKKRLERKVEEKLLGNSVLPHIECVPWYFSSHPQNKNTQHPSFDVSLLKYYH